MTTIELDYPINVSGEEVKQLNMRRAKARDLKKAQSAAPDQASQELHLFALLTDVNPEDLEELDMKDYSKLQGTYNAFLS
jgi:hypothetical protein